MADRFHIRRVRLRGYRSIAECDVELGPLTMLVGPNGAGKSNFVDALRFVADSLNGSLRSAIGDRGGVGAVAHQGARPRGFRVEFDFETRQSTGTYGFEVRRYDMTREFCKISPLGEDSPKHSFSIESKRVRSTETVMPPVSSDRLYLVAAAGIDVFRPVFDGLASVNVFNLNPGAMRILEAESPEAPLGRDGTNIANVVARLESHQADTHKLISDYLSHVVPDLLGVRSRKVESWRVLEFRQRVGNETVTFPVTSMSDGTLRALGVLVASLAAEPGSTAAPVGIEEPETALHPAAAAVLLDALRDAAETRQILVTTHSPDLLDSPDITEDQVLAVELRHGRTRIGPVDAAGQLALRERLLTPGELLRAGQLAPGYDPGETTS